MALIKCPECNKEVSDKAEVCIHCGYPLHKINLKATCIINHIECDVTKIKEYVSALPIEEQKYFIQFLQLQYEISNVRPPISSKKYAEFHEKMGEWANIYKLTNKLTAKLILDCMANNFESFTFDSQPPHPSAPTNQVICPKCGSVSITTEKRGFDLMWGFLGSEWVTYNVCQKCGHRWKIGR